MNYKSVSNSIAMGVLSMGLSLGIIGFTEGVLAVQRRGNIGAEVREIQMCLRKLGYLRANATGNFASLTEDAVRRFQQDNGLAVDGVVGGNTQRLLDSKCRRTTPVSSASGDLAIGSRGDRVRTLQRYLQQLGFYNGSVSGYFGPQTQQAVIRFQQNRGLRADGVVGITTRAAITSSLNGGSTLPTPSFPGRDNFSNVLNQGDRGSQVVDLQNKLRQLRYFSGTSTGFFGDVTRDAVTRFQRDYRLPINGIVDAQTWMAINGAIASLNGGISNGCSQARGEICPGENSQRVVTLQRRLQQLGLFSPQATGYYGPITKDAVTRFQQYYRIPATGYVDLRTWQALNLSGSSPRPNPNPRNDNRYVVIVPIRDGDDTLNKVQRIVPQAFRAESRLGDYVNAGAFSDRNDANKWSKMLRDRGLDARVEFF